MTERRTRKQRADHMAELLADVAERSLAVDAGQGKPVVVDVALRLTPEQAGAFLKFLERGAIIGTTTAAANAAERAEMEGAIWAIGRQFRAEGITTGDDEGQGRA